MYAFLDSYVGNAFDPVKRGPRWDNAWEKFWGKNYPWPQIAVILLAACALFALCYWIYLRDKRMTMTLTVTYLDHEKVTCKYGSLLTPPVPKREGYAFCGWFKDTAFSEPWKSTDKVKKDLTLYPKWVKES